MNHLKNLYEKVRRSLLLESDLTEQQRTHHQWQFIVTLGSITYVVGKGGANTMFYKIGDNEIKYCLPTEMLDKILDWSRRTYVRYAVVDSSGKQVTSHANLDAMLKKFPKKFNTYNIVGITASDKMEPLYKLTRALGSFAWQPLDVAKLKNVKRKSKSTKKSS